MNSWKLRLIAIGFINLIIAIIVGVTRGFSELVIGYVGVALVVTIVGIVWKPKEKTEST